jgi:hypothetical protein
MQFSNQRWYSIRNRVKRAGLPIDIVAISRTIALNPLDTRPAICDIRPISPSLLSRVEFCKQTLDSLNILNGAQISTVENRNGKYYYLEICSSIFISFIFPRVPHR